MSKSVVVCGGGVVGLCCAHHLAGEGHRVTLLERHPEGGDSAAMGNAGYITASHVIPVAAPGMVRVGLRSMRNRRSPFYVEPRWDRDFLRWAWLFWRAANPTAVNRSAPVLRDLAAASRSLYEKLAAETGNPFAFERRGLFHVCRTEEAWKKQGKVAEFVRGLGIEAEVLDAAETARRTPGVTMAIVGSAYFPGDCHLSSAPLLGALAGLVKKTGADLRWNTEVTGWRLEGGRILAAKTSAGEFAADEYVLCGGVWSPRMAASLGLRFPIQAGKGYSLTLANPPEVPAAPMNLIESRIGVTPMGRSIRFAGTMELSGLNDEVRSERVRQMIEAIPQFYPKFRTSDFEGVTPWMGRRPMSPDGLPYLGRTRRHPNLIAACGHSMLGVTLGPITGKLVAELVSGRNPSLNLAPLDPDRHA